MSVRFLGADPVEVRPSDSRAESQAELNGPGGSPTSAPGRVLLHEPELIREQAEAEREHRLQEWEDEGFRLRDGNYAEEDQ